MKKSIKLIIMSALLVVLAAGYFIWQGVADAGGDDTTDDPTDTYTVGSVDYKTLKKILIERRIDSTDDDGEAMTVSFEFNVSDDLSHWLWSENTSVPLDNECFSDMTTAVNDITSRYRMTDVSADELSKYGLDDPQFLLSFTDESGTHSFRVGNYNSFSGTYYLTAEDTSTVYTVSSSFPEAFKFDIYELIDADDAPEVSAGTLTSLEYKNGTESILYTYYQNGKDSDYTGNYRWYASVNGGAEFAVACDIGDALTDALTALSLDNVVSFDASQDTEHGLDTGATLTLCYKKATSVTDSTTGVEKTVTVPASFTMAVGRNADGAIYARAEGSVLTAKLSGSTFGTVLTDNERSLYPTELILLDTSRIDRLDVSTGSGALSIVITHEEEGGTKYALADGESFDSDKLTAFIDALAAARTTAFATDLDRSESVEKQALLSLHLEFNTGDTPSAELTLESYTENYYLVSFMGNAERLISVSDAAEVIAAADALLA